LVWRTHGHVNVFKNRARRDASTAVGGLNQVVAGLAVMFPPERVYEDEWLVELLGFDQESSAINLPCSRGFSHVPFPLWGRENEKGISDFRLPIFDFRSLQLSLFAGGVTLDG
jgi:hypothetical protein